MTTTIEILPYRAAWPAAFAAEGARLRAALGPQALAIHHIGSTSVPGLAAKDVLDAQVTVADLADVATFHDALLALGYEHRPHLADHRPPGLEVPAAGLAKQVYRSLDPRVNLHVRVEGAFNQRYALLFRDFLRAVPLAAHAYGEVKRQLARHFPADVDAYYDVKDPVCDALMAGACEWARATGWAPGPSDA